MNRIKELRDARGLTQKDLAGKLNTTEASVSRYENQDRRLTLPLLRRIAEKLGCTIAEIAGEFTLSGEEQFLLDQYRALKPEKRPLALRLLSAAGQEDDATTRLPFPNEPANRRSG